MILYLKDTIGGWVERERKREREREGEREGERGYFIYLFIF